MGSGIIVCGLNGAGKSTLGKALAEQLQFYFIDSEDIYFPKAGSDYKYTSPRTHKEARKILFNKIKEHENFVFASVKGDYGELVYPFFRYAVLIDVPKNIRIQRVKSRSFKKFGNRILVGGDLYEQEKNFFDFIESRAENTVEEWTKRLNCPIIRVDGMKPIKDNINFIIRQLQA